MSRSYHVLLTAIVLALLIAGPTAAQDTGPETVLTQLVDLGVLSEVTGALDATDRGKTIDLTGFDQQTSWKRGLGTGQYANLVIGGTITWQTGGANDLCGFVFRQTNDNNYIMVGISQNKMLRFVPVVDGDNPDEKVQIAEPVKPGGDDTNELVVVAVGGTITAVVNGEVVDSFTDPVNATGKIGEAMTTYDWADVTKCRFDNVWVWDLGADAPDVVGAASAVAAAPTATAIPAPTATPAQGKPTTDTSTLQHYDAPINEAVAELETLGIIPSGGHEIFREPMAFFEGTGSWFTPLASYKPFTHIVMAGELNFTPSASGEFETCTLMARIQIDNTGSTDTFLEIGMANADAVILVDRVNGTVYAFDSEIVFGISGQPQHFLFTVFRDQANVWLNGELLIENLAVKERSGTYGISLMAEGPGARCEGQNIWAWEVDDVVAFGDQCGVRAGNTVNLRGGPGTNYDLVKTMQAGDTALVVGETTAADGFVWYKLDNDAWVRSDVITRGGDCTAVPQIDG